MIASNAATIRILPSIAYSVAAPPGVQPTIRARGRASRRCRWAAHCGDASQAGLQALQRRDRTHQARPEVGVRTAGQQTGFAEAFAIPGRRARDESVPVAVDRVARSEQFEEGDAFEQVAEAGHAAPQF